MTYIVDFSSLQSEKKTALIILYLVLYSARSRSVTYIAHFLCLRSEIVNFLPRTLFGTLYVRGRERTVFLTSG